ncbi:hypothetical protein GCM10009127_18710 [Alteraurantiacibacter aestuarii]|uniref:hypothetical protein n=1 Tax=Alteraurantiacibacter aestuarii TaxID=650004 RepID=UPI0031D0EC1B
MLKKIIACSVAGGLAFSSVVASAAPIAFAGPNRTASSVSTAEETGGGSDMLVALIALLAGIGIIVVIESGEGGSVPDLPASP